MNADAAREKLAAVLVRFADEHGLGFSPWEHDRFADALLPAVREITAEELRAVAHRLDDGGDEAIEVALGGAAYVHRVLCDTAHALDGKP